MTASTEAAFVTMADGYRLPIDRLDWANIGDLWGRGWSVIPLKPRDKRPAITSWLEYQKRPATFGELEQWFCGDEVLNIGIITGSVSGIFALDADTPEAIDWAERNLPMSDMRVRTQGRAPLPPAEDGQHPPEQDANQGR